MALIFDEEMLKRLCRENAVDSWFKEFEEEDKNREVLLKEHKIKPDFDFGNSKYLQRYILHCPKFKELYNDDSLFALEVLWELKDFKRKLCRSGLEEVHTFTSCKNCKGSCGVKACERR